jgi:uncharacterized membrane protein YphA (DoxX/SURF4 family)
MTRVFVGLLFIVSSIEKIADPALFSRSIGNYGLLPVWSLMTIATVLPWLELLCGFAVLFGTGLRGSSFLLTAMLVVFTAAVVSALARGLDISCGCFTQDPAAGRIGWTKVWQNASLVVLTVYLYYSQSTSYSLLSYFRNAADRQQ